MDDNSAHHTRECGHQRTQSVSFVVSGSQATSQPQELRASTLDNAELPRQTQFLRLSRPDIYLRPMSYMSVASERPLHRVSDFEDVLRGIDRQLEQPIAHVSGDLIGSNGKPVTIQFMMDALDRGERSTDYVDWRFMPADLQTPARSSLQSGCMPCDIETKAPPKGSGQISETDPDDSMMTLKAPAPRTSFESWHSGQTELFFEGTVKSLDEAWNLVKHNANRSSFSLIDDTVDLHHCEDGQIPLRRSNHRPKRSVSMIAVPNPLSRAVPFGSAPRARHSLSQQRYSAANFTHTRTGRARLPPEWIEQQRSRLPKINGAEHPALRIRTTSQKGLSPNSLPRFGGHDNACSHVLSNRASCSCTSPTTPTTARRSNYSTTQSTLTPFTSPAGSLVQHRLSGTTSIYNQKIKDSPAGQIMASDSVAGHGKTLGGNVGSDLRKETVFGFWDVPNAQQRYNDHSPVASQTSPRLSASSSGASSTCLLDQRQDRNAMESLRPSNTAQHLRQRMLEAGAEAPYENPFDDRMHTNSSSSLNRSETDEHEGRTQPAPSAGPSELDTTTEEQDEHVSLDVQRRPLSSLSGYMTYRRKMSKKQLTGRKANKDDCYARMQTLLFGGRPDVLQNADPSPAIRSKFKQQSTSTEEKVQRSNSVFGERKQRWSLGESTRRWSVMGGDIKKTQSRTINQS